MVTRLDLIKYIIMGGSLIACFVNLIDELNRDASLIKIIFYSGGLLIIFITLVFIHHEIVLPIVLLITGFVMLIDNYIPGRLSADLIFFGYGLYLWDNKYVNYIVYLMTAIVLTASNILQTGRPDDLINTFVGYIVVFLLNEIIYTKRCDHVSSGG